MGFFTNRTADATTSLPTSKTVVEAGMDTKSFAAIVTDYNSGGVLYEKNADAKHEIASMTKIMTLLLTFEALYGGKIGADDILDISENAARTSGSTMFLDARSKYKIDDVLQGIIIASANDAAGCGCGKLAGTEGAFVAKMNARAKELGMNDTHFSNCTGLPGEGQFSTARDVNKMTRELVTHEGYFKYSRVWLKDYVHPSGRISTLTNTNKLVRFYEGCEGGKTGYTDAAKHCLSAAAKKDGLRVIATALGAEDSKTRFNDVRGMFDYAFANYENKAIVKAADNLAEGFKVRNSSNESYNFTTSKNVNITTKKGAAELTHEIIIDESIKAPVKAGEVVGRLVVMDGSRVVAEEAVITNTDINEADFFYWFKKVINKGK